MEEEIKRGEGVTASERFLKKLCDNSFLSLWSYTNVFSKPNTELCDLLVVVGEHIIVFSDKHCTYKKTDNQSLNWTRWFRNAIEGSAKQLWGAERWLKTQPNRAFLDAKCENHFPLPIVISEKTKFHLVAIANGAAEECQEVYGGSGSLMFDNALKNLNDHQKPFIVGDLSQGKTFVHVFDEACLEVILSNRDTVSDFTDYLNKREALLRSELEIRIAGEEELLGYFMTSIADDGTHAFILPQTEQPLKKIVFAEGIWENFQNLPQRENGLRANHNSYFWDELIEKFSYFILQRTQYFPVSTPVSDLEIPLRFLAKENRLNRRFLANSFLEIIATTPSNLRATRVIVPGMHSSDEHLYYVFLLLPILQSSTEEDRRIARRNMLEACLLVTRLKFPDALHVVGIAMDSGIENLGKSEDVIYLDCSTWDSQLEEEAIMLQKETNILVNPVMKKGTVTEFPLDEGSQAGERNGDTPFSM